MNPYQQIDFVFQYLKNKTDFSASFSADYIWNLYVDKTPETGINRTMYEEIIKHLVEDGYITEVLTEVRGQKLYHVTFKGRLFNGYVNQQFVLSESQDRISKLEKANELYQINSIRNSKMLNYLTIILAIGTLVAAVYYGIEVLNHWYIIYPKK